MSTKNSDTQTSLVKRVIRSMVKREKMENPMRWSRRLRKIPPPSVTFLQVNDNVNSIYLNKKNQTGDCIKKEPVSKTCIPKPAEEKSTQHSDRLRYHSRNLRMFLRKPLTRSVTAANILKLQTQELRRSLSKHHFSKRFRLSQLAKTCSKLDVLLTKRKQHVLNILNNGNIKDMIKLQSVGFKTAEKIYLYRQVKGEFKTISDLRAMPTWQPTRYQKFVMENFLNLNKCDRAI